MRASVSLLCIGTLLFCLPFQVARAQGSAADLAGLQPVGWPLGVPMSCVEIASTIDASLKDSVVKLRDYCNEHNAKMRAEGFATCALNHCVDSSMAPSNGTDYGSIRLRLGRSQWTDAYYATLLYTFPSNFGGSSGSSMRCFDPAERAQELLRAELETWDFQRFVEFCVKRPRE